MLQEVLTVPGDTPVVDVLIEAYNAVCYPNPFNAGEEGKTDLVRARVTAINFSQYWKNLFEEFRHYNGTLAGLFAQNVFRAAEDIDGLELQVKVAKELAYSFSEHILEADVNSPFFGDDSSAMALTPDNSSELARFLIQRRDEFEGSVMKLGYQPRDISDTWIAFANVLALTDPQKHDFLFAEVFRNYQEADVDTRQEMEEWEGFLGGYDIFDRNHQIKRVIARTLAHFPHILISHLQDPSVKSTS